MDDVYRVIKNWMEEGRRVALATVIRTWGSAPRGVGAQMGVNERGEMVGSVSGGCVEGAVVESALQTLASGQPQYLSYGVADETAWEVGLACGGHIEVFVRAANVALLETVQRSAAAGKAAAMATVLRGPHNQVGWEIGLLADGELVGQAADEFRQAVTAAVQAALAGGVSQVAVVESESGTQGEVFVQIYQPQRMLVLIGGVHIAVALAAFAKILNYRTVVVDPRRSFGSQARFEHADEVLQLWPQAAFSQAPLTANTAVAVLTHDPKIDDPALALALRSPAFYIGALGSRTTHQKRLARLRAEGFSETELARIHSPIGLDLGGRSPEEIALAVMAEIVHTRQRALAPA